MKRTQQAAALLLAALAALALLFACETGKEPRFPHETHMTLKECGGPGQPKCLTCLSCHNQATNVDDPVFSNTKICSDCHKEEQAVPTPRPLGARPGIRFSHEQHLKLPQLQSQCFPCHAPVVDDDATEPPFPPMSQCLTCHQEQFDQGVCRPCHTQEDLSGQLPQTFMVHDATWRERHGMAASRSRQVCSQCHSQTECNDCHDVSQALLLASRRPQAIERDLVHRADFMSRHGIEAQSQSSDCMRCHKPETCDSCHLARGVSGSGVNARNPHPPGWVGSPASSNLHGPAARRDLLSCAACHDHGPATNCIRCHQVGGFGGNPHPNGWQSSRTPEAAMCRYCHGG